jgi:hypothetical protein
MTEMIADIEGLVFAAAWTALNAVMCLGWARHAAFARRERYFKTSWMLNRGIRGATADYEPGWFGFGLFYVGGLAVLTGVFALAGLAMFIRVVVSSATKLIG